MRAHLTRNRLVAVLGTILLAGCATRAATPDASADADKDADKRVVEVATAARVDIAPELTATANLESEREAKVMSQVAGEVTEILVEEGQSVAAGQILARIDSKRAQLELAKSKSVADRMAHEAERNQQLLERHLVSRDAADKSRYDRDWQTAAVDMARLTVEHGVIRAPYAGVVTRRNIKQGQWLELQSPAFEIADFGALKAKIAVPERDAVRLAAGQPVNFAVDAVSGKTFTGTVERVSPVVDRATGTVTATIAVNNADHALRPGMFARMAVAYAHIDQALLVPKKAINIEDGRQQLFVIENGTARRKQVVLGAQIEDRVEIRSGLDDGAVVVTNSGPALRDGDIVIVANVQPTKVVAKAES